MMSSGSIISTASSNSHKKGDRKKQAPLKDGLQVAGMKLGSQRKGYIPSKFDTYSYNLRKSVKINFEAYGKNKFDKSKLKFL